MKQRRGLIMYASVTGNTEKIAEAFARAMDKNGWEAVLLKIDSKTNFHTNPVYLNEYDVVALGSPNMAGLPSPQVQRCFGMVEPKLANMFSDGPVMGAPGENPKPGEGGAGMIMKDRDAIKAVVFETYAGRISEATSVLAVETQYLECKGLSVCGQFACPGHEIHHMGVDSCAIILGIAVEHAADALEEYRRDPSAPRFAKLSEKQHKQMAAAVADPRDDPAYDDMLQMGPMGKYDLANRPNARDELKAEIFMEEIIQDYFTGKDIPERTARGQYLCIS